MLKLLFIKTHPLKPATYYLMVKENDRLKC